MKEEQQGPQISANELFETIGRLTWERDRLVKQVQELKEQLEAGKKKSGTA